MFNFLSNIQLLTISFQEKKRNNFTKIAFLSFIHLHGNFYKIIDQQKHHYIN